MCHTKVAGKMKTYFLLRNLFPKIVPFMRCGKIWYRQTVHT
jgi:hypothetical protein